ncbi:MAG TPA: sigma-70 family RNA polymerase sigma factor [Bryobacteraceae bacterium]|nr:sigma-70 family RNA polymerase sigma factor [Bryobacteraceae bacterium]
MLSCHASLYRYARSLCGEQVAAEELLQETYKKALAAKRGPAEATVDHVRPWMFTIMRNAWQNEIRRQSRAHEVWLDDVDALEDPDSPDSLLTRKLLVSEVRAAVDSMPVLWREIIVMRDLEELSYGEISSILGCPVGTVMSRLARARSALRQMLVGRVSMPREVDP